MKLTKFLCVVGMTAMFAAVMTVTGCRKNDEVPALTGIKMASSAVYVPVGGTDTLRYDVIPEGAKVAAEKWMSRDEKVVKVSDEGVITGVDTGSVWVSVTVDDRFTDMCKVTVTPVYPEAPGLACVMVAGFWWAPVNCGYDAVNYPYGKLYQWGRKYGCGYKADDETAALNDKGGLLQETMIGPIAAEGESENYFYISQIDEPFDWLAVKDDKRWNSGTEEAPVKTKHDPCPDGWRVPTYTELNTLTGNNGYHSIGTGGVDSLKVGCWFNGTKSPIKGSGLFLPAPGGRYFFDGDCFNRNSLAGYFSSTAKGDMMSGLCFAYGFVGMDTGYRANGLSVRCIKEDSIN